LLCKMVSKASWSPSMSTSNSSISLRTVVLVWTVNLVPGLVTSKGCAWTNIEKFQCTEHVKSIVKPTLVTNSIKQWLVLTLIFISLQLIYY
jgi:hypothetical protein